MLKSSAATTAQVPREATMATPASVMTTPSICNAVTRSRKNNTPASNTSTGIIP